jgi:putative addiction module component (TIGR02574 family)
MVTSNLDLESLSVDEQLSLIDRLWENIERAAANGDRRAILAMDNTGNVTPELMAELRRRVDEHRRNPGSAIPWETLKAELKRRFG